MDRARYFLSSIEKNINFKNWQIFIELLKGTGQPHLATLFDQGYDEALTGDKVKGVLLVICYKTNQRNQKERQRYRTLMGSRDCTF